MRVFDAAMLDVNLNGNDNWPVAEAFVTLGVPFVCSTGNSGHDIGCATPKPFKYEALGARPDRHRDGYLLQSSRLRLRLRG
jgi:hypothetical protein